MSNEFNREERYIVFKLADVENDFFPSEISQLLRLHETQQNMRKQSGKPPLECVVVESDWPEYEPTWRAIEARVTGAQAQPAPSVPETWLERGLKELDAIRQNSDRDDWHPNDENLVRRLYQAMVADGLQQAPKP